VRGIAKYGRGKDEFIVSGERIEGTVMKQLKRALSPILKEVTVDWGKLPIIESHYNIKPQYPPIFNGEKLIIYNFLSAVQIDNIYPVIITGKTGDKVHHWEVPIDCTKDRIEGSLIHRLTAKQYIRSLESAPKPELNKIPIVDIATYWGLVSKYTSFVAVEERDSQSEASTGLLNLNIMKQMELIKKSTPIIRDRDRDYRIETLSARRRSNQMLVGAFDEVLTLSSRPTQLSGLSSQNSSGFSGFSNPFSGVGDFLSELLAPRRATSPPMAWSSRTNSIDTKKDAAVALRESEFSGGRESGFSGGMEEEFSGGMEEGCSRGSGAESKQRTFRPKKSIPRKGEPQTNQRPLDKFIFLQSANGAFRLNAEFISSAGLKNDLKELINLPEILKDSPIKDKNEVWATVIALVVFEKAFNDLRDEWELLYEKCKKYVNSQLKGYNVPLSQLQELANILLRF